MSDAISVKIKGKNEFIRAISKAPGIMDEELNKSLKRAALEVSRLARKKAPKAFSHLIQSIIPGSDQSLVHYVKAGVNYASGVEFGTAPGRFPSRKHIEEWMKIKGIRPMNGSLRSASFLIARSIEKNGTLAQPFMQPALEEKRQRIVELVRVGERRALKRISRV